jgi:hypothetical protein
MHTMRGEVQQCACAVQSSALVGGRGVRHLGKHHVPHRHATEKTVACQLSRPCCLLWIVATLRSVLTFMVAHISTLSTVHLGHSLAAEMASFGGCWRCQLPTALPWQLPAADCNQRHLASCCQEF